jgi:hypothetical protein
MTDDQSNPRPSSTAATPDHAPKAMPTAPNSNPFARPPEPERSIPEAMAAACHEAYGEWREYLPHGWSIADYEPLRFSPIRDLAICSATTPLRPILPLEEIAAAAETAADAAFIVTSRELSQFEPD